MNMSCLVVLWPVVGCALSAPNATEQASKEYRRDVSRIEAIEEFEERKRACHAAGGALQIDRTSSGRLSPALDEWKMASCTRPIAHEGPV
jgi:hypothetical protein